AGTTSTGLPRRVSRSIKPGATGGDAPPTAFDVTADDAQDQFLADLDGFTDGEMAAQSRDADAEDGDSR
ncbi:MAG: ATP-binding protein, partial [Pseudonocardia sp.]|nr:ATP-binding protein [Pseudonocardia sp.]